MTKVLITGAAGFIGSHVCQACLDEGWDVDGVDDLSNGHVEFVPRGVNFMRGDFAANGILDRVRREGNYDYVFHLAAKARVSWSIEHPIESNDDNVTKTLKLIEACKGNIKRFIFSSSSSVYGNSTKLPLNTSANLPSPESPYALQKYIIEEYLRMYATYYKLDSICLRYFNVYGPHQVGGSPYATALGNWLAAIVNDKPLRFDGDGSQSRDLTYVTDVAKANILAAKYKREESYESRLTNVFNVGTGRHVSNNQILKMLGDKFGTLKVQFAPVRPGDVKTTQADIAETRVYLNYSPEFYFDQGFEKTVKWALTSPHMKNLKSTTG